MPRVPGAKALLQGGVSDSVGQGGCQQQGEMQHLAIPSVLRAEDCQPGGRPPFSFLARLLLPRPCRGFVPAFLRVQGAGNPFPEGLLLLGRYPEQA